ncbi:hypothetical protein K431DRAFT_272455 [Polychaeton citri CBS 116435]|uniref:Nuclear pore complex protein Nup85 n=1 Tax=Polychaeton citri CBS 116435 TaxID=1314669 RepID=A0A9P4Q784_9PEZI|nr:hypothetical protein K431DRAFT_272455 [Polychaeton citri CBS 116435]
MAFRFPGEPPSTPNSRKLFQQSQQPSTTPAGPPPSYLTQKSTTPAGPPPSRSLFGSSYNAVTNTFPRNKITPGRLNRGFGLPSESSPIAGEDEDDYDDYDDEEDVEGEYGDETMEGIEKGGRVSPSKSAMMSSFVDSPRGFKRSRNGQVQQRQQASDMAAVARGFAQKVGAARIQDTGEVVLKVEELTSRLDAQVQNVDADEIDGLVTRGVAELDAFLEGQAEISTGEGGLGPESQEGIAKAEYIASLLLQLHHPHSTNPITQAQALTKSRALTRRALDSAVPIPRALLNWLNTHHNPYPDDFEAIHMHQPGPSENDRFWDTVYYTLLRGKLSKTIRLLKDAAWEHAATAIDDGADAPGYVGHQLYNVRDVVASCIAILETCPAISYDDWDVKGSDWDAFRQRVRNAIRDLEAFAEGTSADRDAEPGSRHTNIFGESLRSSRGADGFSLSTASRRAESKVPWSIYENLKVVYGMLLGGEDEVLLAAQDWLEGTVYLSVWWDGRSAEDGADLAASFRRSSMRRSQGHNIREIDVAPLAAYRRRIADSFAIITENPEEAVFSVNTMEPVQVALACVLEDQTAAAISLLKSFSMTVATAVIEVAALGAWVPDSTGRTGAGGNELSSEDLLVLSYGPGAKRPLAGDMDRDTALGDYADLLAKRQQFTGTDSRIAREGWELAVSVLRRLSNGQLAERKISEIVDKIELTDEERVEKVLMVCNELGLLEQVRSISERYADSLADSDGQQTPAYGSALLFYARAHATSKLRELLSLLTSMCLLHSAAVPILPDHHLTSFLSKDRIALRQLARTDAQAATLLSDSLSGYATLRKFYDLRDASLTTSRGFKISSHLSHLRPIERNREAAIALLAIIESAADCIHGGLYDPEVESIISVETLLALLGECLPLLGQEKRVFSQKQVFTLLRIVEDFAQVGGRVRDGAEELLKASVAAYKGTLNTSPEASQSGSLGGSWEILASQSLVLVKDATKGDSNGAASHHRQIKRQWDWRKGLNGIGSTDVGAKDVLATLRVALGMEVARGWGGLIRW